jgi:hypothetical protein
MYGSIIPYFWLFKIHDRSTMVFDHKYINWTDSDFAEYDWTGFYNDTQEDIPPNAPKPRGHPVQINVFVDASHASNKLNRRLHTGILIYLNSSPTIWYSKSQKNVESSTFGSEFVALRIATEKIKGLLYKLRMLGVPLDGPAKVLVDNDTVIKNATIPSSSLQKRHDSTCYHYVREAVASKVMCVACIPSSENLADMFTKNFGSHQIEIPHSECVILSKINPVIPLFYFGGLFK